jgi:hypothetical protein
MVTEIKKVAEIAITRRNVRGKLRTKKCADHAINATTGATSTSAFQKAGRAFGC